MDEKHATRDTRFPASTEMPLVHFSIRQLLLFMAGVSLICWILVSLEGYSAVVFGIGVVLVGGHVLSTAIGSRLRASADAMRQWDRFHEPASAQSPGIATLRPQPTRPSQLQVRTACGRLLWWFVGVAMGGGAIVGGGALHLLAGPTVGWPGMLIGALSAAMVVGWAAFVVAGICGIARRSWRETVADSNKLRG